MEVSGSVNIPAAIGGGVTAGLVLVGVILLLLWRIFYYQVQSSKCKQHIQNIPPQDQIRSLTQAELDMFRNGDPDKINDQLDVHEQTDLLPYDK